MELNISAFQSEDQRLMYVEIKFLHGTSYLKGNIILDGMQCPQSFA